MRVNKKLVAGAMTAGVIGLTGVAGTALAADNTNANSSPMSSLVQKIADKFNVDKAEVQKVFDEARAEHRVEHEQRFNERLDALVSQGKITAEQKTLIIEKFSTMKAEREANRDSGTRPTRAEMEAKKAELDKWAAENGIDLSVIMPARGEGGFGSRGSHGHAPM